MKIFSAGQIRDWDQYTILNEPISSLGLMERAATACVDWLLRQYPDAISYGIFCGKGNNGGDGLAIARLLLEKGYTVYVNILEFGHKGSADFQQNLGRLHKYPQLHIHFIQAPDHFQPTPPGQILVDALIGTGLNRALDGLAAGLVDFINTAGEDIVSIDVPSGLFTDHSSRGNTCIHATHTLTFQQYKTCFLLPENQDKTGTVQVLDIGLTKQYAEETDTRFELTDDTLIHFIYRPRLPFAHKGNFGHSLLICGSKGKIGAAVLAARACLRSGTGLLTVQVPACGYSILQSAVPEAMTLTDDQDAMLSNIVDSTAFTAAGIGPGIGQDPVTADSLLHFLQAFKKPVVIDADALNILSARSEWQSLIPPGSILTPHPKEFERLAGSAANDFERLEKVLAKAAELKSVIILKGHYSFIATPGGKGYFNSSGNPGMATGGSGDVLTGILTGLLAQGYGSVEAAIFGAYIHGLAGDMAAKDLSQEALIAGDLCDYLGKAFLHLAQ